MVAVAALVACVAAGLVPANAAFSGFGHPAVVTGGVRADPVARAADLGRGVDLLTTRVLPHGRRRGAAVATSPCSAPVLSAL